MIKWFKAASLGCKVNQYETQFLRTAFLANGYREFDEENGNGPEREKVSLVLINTCSVTAESDAKSRKLIAHYAKLFPNAEIVVLGCYAASATEQVVRIPHVSEVVPDKRELVPFLRRRGLSFIPTGIHDFGERHRAYVKIQDGCQVGCSYCLIPKVRPYLLSRPVGEILAEISCLVRNRFREIILTGIHLGHYGVDISPDRKINLATLVDRIMKTRQADSEEREGLFRLRLGSLEAVEVSDLLIEQIADPTNILCPHLHLSMQSGDDTVLRNMRRRWMSEPFIQRCFQIQERVPDVALTTDVIVGFPGETEEQFLRTCSVVEQLGFSKVHAFRYSRRPGTIAATMPDQVSELVKKERLAHLQELAYDLRCRYARRFVGRTVPVLLEDVVDKPENGSSGMSDKLPEPRNALFSVYRGTSDRYLTVEATSETGLSVEPGDLCSVLVETCRDDVLIGKICRR